MFDGLKSRLLVLGPHSTILSQCFRVQAASFGISLKIEKERITLTKGRRRVLLARQDHISIPFLVRQWHQFFASVASRQIGEYMVLDFSCPGEHRYLQSGLTFYCMGIAEDDCMDAYTSAYLPKHGDVVWDVGAHAGLSSCLLARMVGPTGIVYAFEPDEASYRCLLRNIAANEITNVIPLQIAVSDVTGTATFVMDGSMGAGLSAFVVHGGKDVRIVDTLSFADACERYSSIPAFVKLDVEGAELSVIAGALKFLTENDVHFSIESNHRVDGEFTASRLEALFKSIGYRSWSSEDFGQLFTWAKPASD